MSDVYQSSNAAANLTKIFEAAANAQKANVDLKKEVMLHQLQQKMDLEQKAKESIQEKNINYNYVPGGDNSNIANGESSVATASPMADVLNPASGQADSGTPSSVAGQAPMASVVNPAQDQQPDPPMSIANPGNTGESPVYQQPPAMTPAIQPQQPSVQYQNLGYTPKESQDLIQERRNNGQSPNVADAAYVQSLNKLKSGTATQGEVDMVHKMNNRGADGIALPQPGQPAVGGTPPGNADKGLRMIEQRLGYPEGSLWRNPSTMAPELSPIWKSKMEATQRAQANYDVNQPFREDKRQDALENKYADRLSKIVSFRSGSLGVQDAKVNSGIHALNLLDQAYDPKTKTFNIPPIMQAELAANVNNAISNQNVTSDSMRQDLMQRSIYGDWNKTMQYILNAPKNSLPQDNAKLLAAMIIRQGPVAERERDKDMQDLKDSVPSGLDPERARHLEQIQFGNSFTKELGKSQFYKDLFANDPKYRDLVGGSNESSGNAPSYKAGDTRVIGGKTVTRDANGTWS